MASLLALLLAIALSHVAGDCCATPTSLCHTDADHVYIGGDLYNDTTGKPMPNHTSGGATACCAMCQETASCVFWTLNPCGCNDGNGTSAGCCFLKTDEAWAGRKFGWQSIAGSVRPLPPIPSPGSYPPPSPDFSPLNITTWHVVWTGGQSNALGTNSQSKGYPRWNTTRRIQMFCAADHPGEAGEVKPGQCKYGTFAPAGFPHGGGLWGEANVGFSKTFANLLLATLPADHGIVTVNTAIGGTGFIDGRWAVPNGGSGSGCLTQNSVTAVKKLQEMLPGALGGTYHFSTMLWHQGEQDAGDHPPFHDSYCHYLQDDMGALIDHLRANFPGATAGTPFLDGGMLPYWVDKINGTEGVMSAIYAVNTSRPCTGTADSRIFPDFFPGTKTPAGDPHFRSGSTGDVIHFNATMATVMGHQYWAAYQRALMVTTPVASARTAACNKGGDESVAPVVTCTK
jgi:hypothetical protein